MTETIPFDFPGYRLQSMVGRGGMGRVYLAEQLATHRTVAVKVLDRGTTDPARLAAFRREAATVAQLEHPHVVPLYDYGDYQGTQYLVFRFLTGGTVADRIRAGAIEIDTAVRWIDDVASALVAAHQRGIIRRATCCWMNPATSTWETSGSPRSRSTWRGRLKGEAPPMHPPSRGAAGAPMLRPTSTLSRSRRSRCSQAANLSRLRRRWG
jgi:hypothetical protein